MSGNQTLNCEHFNATNSSSDADKFAISMSCALFDFVIYTLAMGTLTVLGVLGNAVAFVVLLRDRGRSATSFLLQALAVADTLVLLAAVPLYVVPAVYPFTGRLAGYYRTYTSLMPILWPVYLTPDTRAPVTDRPANDERQISANYDCLSHWSRRSSIRAEKDKRSSYGEVNKERWFTSCRTSAGSI